MLLQKTFHVHQDLDATKVRLGHLRAYRHALLGFQQAAVSADGLGQFEFLTSLGSRLRVGLAALPTDDANHMLFQSTGGNADVSGLIEFIEIRPGLTEIQVTLDYTLHSRVHRVLDRLTGSVDRFLNHQLRALTAHFAGERSPSATRSFRRPVAFAPEAQLAH